MPTPQQAHDDMMASFHTAWLADEDAQDVAVLWPNVRGDIDPARQTPSDAAKPWVRISTQHEAATAGSGAGIFEHRGVLTVEINVPMAQGLGFAWRLVRVALNAFRETTTPNGVTFGIPSPSEIGVDGPWFRVDVRAEFQYSDAM